MNESFFSGKPAFSRSWFSGISPELIGYTPVGVATAGYLPVKRTMKHYSEWIVF
jgi:hypothetical protein